MSSEGPEGASAARGAGASEELSEEELRAAYEAELARITSAEVMLQAAVSLLNIGGRRLGLGGGDPAAGAVRDLDQVRDAIDGVRALLGVLERSSPAELGPLRDALAQLQIAYAREAQAGAPAAGETQQAAAAQDRPAGGEEGQAKAEGGAEQRRPGPAESSGRLWVPGS